MNRSLSDRNSQRLRRTIAPFVLTVLATTAGCSSTSAGYGTAVGSGSGGTLSITTPSQGSAVSQPFTLGVSSDQPLGRPDTGQHHVHIWFDGRAEQYKVNYGTNFQIDCLAAGRHVITAVLANADHSLTGAKASVTVTIKQPTSKPGTCGDTSPAGDGSPAAGPSGTPTPTPGGYTRYP